MEVRLYACPSFIDNRKERNMKLICKFESVDMGNEIISVPVGEQAAKIHGILKLNAEGQEILSLLEKQTTEEQVVDALAAKYENDRKNLEEYVHMVLNKLRASALLDE